MGDSSQPYIRIERPEPIIRADSIVNVAFERRDVPSMSRFLVDFGLIALETRDNVRYFRGDDLPDALRPKFPLRLLWSMVALGRQGKIDMSRMAGVKKALSVPPLQWLK
jgi:hypothetical protein